MTLKSELVGVSRESVIHGAGGFFAKFFSENREVSMEFLDRLRTMYPDLAGAAFLIDQYIKDSEAYSEHDARMIGMGALFMAGILTEVAEATDLPQINE